MHHKDLIKTPSLKHTINDKHQIEERVGKYLIFLSFNSLPVQQQSDKANNPFNNFLVLKK